AGLAEQLLLRLAPVDLGGSRLPLDGVDLRLLVGGEVAVELAEAHQVHQVDVPGEGRLLQAPEAKGPPDAEVEALDVAGAGEGADGEDVPRLEAVELQERRQVPVEDLVALVEVVVVGVEELVEELVQAPFRGPEHALENPHRLLRLQPVELEEDLPGLGPVLPHVATQGVAAGDGVP